MLARANTTRGRRSVAREMDVSSDSSTSIYEEGNADELGVCICHDLFGMCLFIE